MAVAGSCCSGVVYEMRGGTVAILRTETRISSQFDSVTEAIPKRGRGERAAVRGADAFALRQALTTNEGASNG